MKCNLFVNQCIDLYCIRWYAVKQRINELYNILIYIYIHILYEPIRRSCWIIHSVLLGNIVRLLVVVRIILMFNLLTQKLMCFVITNVIEHFFFHGNCCLVCNLCLYWLWSSGYLHIYQSTLVNMFQKNYLQGFFFLE